MMMRVLIILSLSLIIFFTGFSQENIGFGFYNNKQDFPCLTDEQREEIMLQITKNIKQLKQRGIISGKYSKKSALFEFPIAGATSLTDHGFHGISGFVDQDPAYPNFVLDYNCGDRSYDLSSGYNHKGIDYFNWPFSWYKMDHDNVEIVASAPGTIVLKQDGYYDRNCGFGSGYWNAVFVQHSDGSVAWYGHMKKYSLTSKLVGDTVNTGEFLGVVGSSGNSTGPHLHLEVYDSLGNLVEPYAGPCNTMNSLSWWINQRPYYDSAINKLMTHDAPPEFPPCPQQEILHDQNYFSAGDTVYTAAYYRDQLNTQISEYWVLEPDSSIWLYWDHNSNASHYSASYWYFWWTLPANAQNGTWIFKVNYENNTYFHDFYVGVNKISNQRSVSIQKYKLNQNYPNPFNPSTTIEYSIPKSGLVLIKLYNIRGEEIQTFREQNKNAGTHRLTINGENLASGIYLYSIKFGGLIKTRKMILLR